MVHQQIGVLGTVHGDLVAQAPEADGGVVVALGDELGHLRHGILPALGHVLGDVGDLRPDDEATLVAEVIEILVVLVVGQTDGGGTHLADQVDVLGVVLRQQGVAEAHAVLMAADAPQGILPAVEDEAPLGVHGEAAHAEAGGNGVEDGLALQKLRAHGVHVGIPLAVPEPDLLNDKIHSLCVGGVDFQLLTLGQEGVADGLALLTGGGEDLDPGAAVRALHGGGHMDAGGAVGGQIEVALGNADDLHAPVQTAVEGEVRHLGIDSAVGSVVHLDADGHLVSKLCGDVAAEAGVAAVVVDQVLAAHKHVRAGVGGGDLQEHPLPCGQVCPVDGLFVNALAPPVVAAAVHAVDGVPGVRQVHGLDLGKAVLAELPCLVQGNDVSHSDSSISNCIKSL